MDKNKHLKKAKEFSGEGRAYIHCEVKNGETELAVGGDGRGIMYGCYRALKRFTELTGYPMEDVINFIEILYEHETNGGNKNEQ